RALLLSLTQESGNNIVKVGETISQVVDEYRNNLPEDIFLKTVFEQAPAVRARINDFLSNLMQGVILVGVVVFIFLGFRSSIIIMTVIPLAIIMAIAILDIQGYALQQISIAGLVIALGLLVDNGIVVVENIKRFMAMGYSPKEAAIKGTSEVGFAIISSTATTVLAFFPLANLESGAGEFLRTLPLTVIFALTVSLILALTFTPIVAAKLLKPRKKPEPRWFDKQLNGFIERFYSPVLTASLKRGWVVMVIGFSLLVGAVMLFPSVGVSFFPTADKPMLLVEVDAPRGSSMARTDKAMSYVSQVLDTTDFVRDYTTNTGHGNPMIYYNRVNQNFKKYYGQVLINFNEWDPAEFYKVLDQLRFAFAQYPDAKITFNELKNGPPFEAPIEIKIIGDDLDILKAKAFELEEIIATTEGTIDVDNPFRMGKMDLEVRVNRDKAGLAGVSLAAIYHVLRSGVDGLRVDDVSINQDDYELIIQTDYDESRITSLKKLFVSNQLAEQVPLSQLADITFVSGVAEILHYNKDRSVAVTANVTVPDAVTKITEDIIARLDEVELPEGYEFFVAGEYEGQQNSFGDLGQLLLVALFGIFAVLVLQFRSLKQPMIVFAAIPLAVTGSFVALFLTGWSFSFFAFVGFNSLIGIVVNNSIILVDYTNQLIRSGQEKKEAIIIAAKTRFTPILLTSATTILGLVPLTFQATNLWSPLGWTIIGGMISSTFLTLLVVPILYNWFTTESSFVEEKEEENQAELATA
ncbi:MAG: efflux RND transporter permease subunit, partial [Bacteroidota bacterium]